MTERVHLGWVDLLRIIACFLVVVSHSCDPFVAQFDANPGEFLIGAFVGSMMRVCVPLFAMMSGVLLLPVKMEMGEFYSKRAKRILIPLIFWSVALPVLYFLYVNYLMPQSVNPALTLENYTWESTLQKMYLFIFNFNYDTTPLWYLYMLIGLYLFMPIISPWLMQASQKDMKKFLYIWAFSTLIPYIQMAAPYLGYTGNYGNIGLFGICDWNAYGTFFYFSGFLGYIVLAYYLVRFPITWSWSKTLAITLPLFIVGYAITAFGFILTQQYYPGSYANLEIIWYFSGANVLMMTVSIFIIIQKLTIKSTPLLRKLAALTFGVYLCHFIFVQFAYDMIYPNIDVPAFVKIILIAVSSSAISLLVAWLFSLNKYTRKAIM